jgi:hypothetical protein
MDPARAGKALLLTNALDESTRVAMRIFFLIVGLGLGFMLYVLAQFLREGRSQYVREIQCSSHSSPF